MPYQLTPAADPMAIAERQYGTKKTEVRFTAFTSCIGIVSRTGDEVTGVHLSIKNENGELFDAAAIPQVMAALGANYTEVFIIGSIDIWQNPDNGVADAYAELERQVRDGVNEQDFNTYPLGNGTYGGEIEDDRLGPTYV
ncbi:hypothetical protein [Pseudovibrio sp. JE062]|uniref:hypothetical protein n=1 Tax=Pseudovibrio sp. JE062 TaxID=439495 RepID=UPI000186C396|nr:hypothetical protein [Pseudovibrio sp. JE062]EEA96836.1 conserved hypothetical protein [Pseudovibrio sp. JE062]